MIKSAFILIINAQKVFWCKKEIKMKGLIKTETEIECMRQACAIVRDTLKLLEEKIKVGMTTFELDKIARDYIHSCGAKCSFKGYQGYPGNICVSINQEVVHGIPSKKRIIKDGDIVSCDVGAYFKGFHGDAARTFAVGNVKPETLKLIEVTKQSFFEGINGLKAGCKVGELSERIQKYVEANGYSVIRMLEGHGVGRNLHEYPSVPNYGKSNQGATLYAGMTIAIEPMINMGKKEIVVLDDDWTIESKDGSMSAHYENTILITEDGVEILTL